MMTEKTYTFCEDSISDLHKDAYGMRPGEGFWQRWREATDDEKQAEQIKRRLDVTDMVHAAKYDFQVYHGNTYWLVFDSRKQFTRLVMNGPNDWSTGKPEDYEYICPVKWLGDHTWVEVE